ncbi:MAG: NAD-dependent epimerase/dehydratase family protein [Desulfamplus sp.]|nr:NAD-dependent epimerase/dehydratase family protein [Desulfamplus sp.]
MKTTALGKKALVTGATGKIGPLLVNELLRQNFRVRLLLRQSPASPNLMWHPDVEISWGDITDYPAVLDAVSGVNYVFHLAALLHLNTPPASIHARYYEVNVIGTQNIIDASFRANVKRVVIFSTISVYGKGTYKNIFSETSPVNPLTIYAKTKFLAEKKVWEKVHENIEANIEANIDANIEANLQEKVQENLRENLHKKVPERSHKNNISSNSSTCVTILRLASVYGRHMTGNYLRLIQAVRAGFFCIPVRNKDLSFYINCYSGNHRYLSKLNIANKVGLNGGALRTLIHEDDVVSAAILAATHPEAAGKTYNLTDGNFHSLEEVVQAIADALCVRVKILKIPQKLFKKLSDFIHMYNHKIKKAPGKNIKKEDYIEKIAFAIDKLMENVVVDGSKIQTELGFKPRYNLKNGWNHALWHKK